MLKIKASKKEIRNKAHKILSVGYCDMGYLLRSRNAFSYCSGVYGWSCDNYYIEDYNLVISTGYAPLNNQNIKEFDYKLIREYEAKARDICNTTLTYQEKEVQVNNLLNELLEKIIK